MLIRVDLLIVDDFALHQLDPLETQDVYDIVVESTGGHRDRDLEPLTG